VFTPANFSGHLQPDIFQSFFGAAKQFGFFLRRFWIILHGNLAQLALAGGAPGGNHLLKV